MNKYRQRRERQEKGNVMNETNGGYGVWLCAVGPSHSPDHPEGTSDGLGTCTGCGNDLWVGYPVNGVQNDKTQ